LAKALDPNKPIWAATRASSDSFSLSGMATPQISSVLPTTDSQLPKSSSATLIEDMTLNSASIYPQSHPRSPLSTAISNSTQTTEQHAPTGMGPMSSSIHNGANLILDLIRKERQQALEVGQRQIAHIQQQHNEYCASYSKAVREESTKRRDAEEKILYLTGELAKYTKGPSEAQNIALQAKADATAARNTASEAERAAAEARSHLTAVQDALQKVGITVSRDDSVPSDTLKIILGTPWLELIPSQIHSPHLPLPDSSSAPVDKPSSSPPQHLGSPSKFITFIKEHINHLSDTLTASQNSYKDLDSQCNQLQSDLCTLRLDRNQLESLKKETEDNAKILDQWKSKLEKLEIEIKLLKVERDDAVKAQEEAATALEEMRRTSATSAVALTSCVYLLFST
jgi:predicted  nucleic acid-binding Zn-ribbon protein